MAPPRTLNCTAGAHKLLPNVLPYTVGTQAVFGYGLWNGRSQTDCAPDVMFSLATNTALSTVDYAM